VVKKFQFVTAVTKISALKLKDSDFSERLASMNTSEEMGQARDTSTHVTFNALNSTSSPRILNSLFTLFNGREDGKKESSNLRLETELRN